MHRNPGLGDFIQAKVLVSPVVKHEPGLIVQPELEFSPDKIISSFGDFINFGCTTPFHVPVPTSDDFLYLQLSMSSYWLSRVGKAGLSLVAKFSLSSIFINIIQPATNIGELACAF
jgi:hypothetical protein